MRKMLFRKLRKRKVQTIGIVLLAFLWMFVASFAINLYLTNVKFKEHYYNESQVEDFHFIVMDEDKAENLAKKYHFAYEKQYCCDFDDNQVKYRILSNTENINLPGICEGEAPKSNTEIMLNQEYAECHNIHIGDVVAIKGDEYKVSGIFNLITYMKMHTRDDASAYDANNQALIITTEDMILQKCLGDISISYLARFDKSLTDDELNTMTSGIIREEDLINVTLRSENSNITVLDGKISVYFILTVISLCVMSVIIVLLLVLFIYLIVNEDRKTIGILLANGMKKGKIWLSYLGLIVALLLPSGAIGYCVGSFAAPILNDVLEQDMSLPPISFSFQSMFFGVFMAVILYVALFATLIGVTTILCKSIIELLKNNKVKKISRFEVFIKKLAKRKNVEKRMRLSIAARNKLLLVLVLFSVFAAEVEFLLSYSIYTMPEKMKSVQMDSINYENEVYFDEMVLSKEKDNQYFYQLNAIANTGKGENAVKIIALDEGNLIRLNQNEIEPGKAIINRTTATVLGVNEGDSIEIEIYDRKETVTVQTVCDRVVGKEIFMNYKYMISKGFIEEGYNGMYTNNKEITNEDVHVATVVSKKEIMDNYDSSSEVMKAGSVILAILGILIPAILIAITVSVLLAQSKKEIAILKANGITKRSMEKMIYGSYNAFLVLGIAIGVPYSYMILQIIFSIAVKASGIKYPVQFDLVGIVFSILLTCVIYFGAMWINKIRNRTNVERITYDFG